MKILKVDNEHYNKILKLAQKVYNALPNHFYLAGGTAVMLKYKHRLSTDIYFFSHKNFSFNYYKHKFFSELNITSYSKGEDNIDFIIEGTKVSLVRFYYKNIKRRERIKNIFVASDYDLFLNKIYAAGRRIEWKDPYDAAFLLKKHDWDPKDVKRDFEIKFDDADFYIFIGALLNKKDYKELPEWVWKTLSVLQEI